MWDTNEFPRLLSGKESTCNAGAVGLIPGSGRSPGEGNGNPLQYSYLGNPMDRGAWQAVVHGLDMTQQLNNDRIQIHRNLLYSCTLTTKDWKEKLRNNPIYHCNNGVLNLRCQEYIQLEMSGKQLEINKFRCENQRKVLAEDNKFGNQ